MQDRSRILIRVVPVLIAVALIGFQYLSSEKYTNELGRKSHVALSPQQESQLGLQSYQQVLSQSQRVTAGPQYDMVRRVAERIERATGEGGRGFQWEVSLVRDQQANAFCLPGGKIVVFTGILPVAKTDAGLATVVGHEVGHAIARHGSERLFREKAASTFMQGVQWSLADQDYQSQRQIMGILGAGAQYGILMPWGRDQESEADHLGLLYLARAGYDPSESISFWERMEKTGGKAAPEWMSTHPSHGTRIDQLKGWMPQAQAEFEKARRSGNISPNEPLER